MNVLFTVLVTFFAGMGAGLGTGFAGMSAAAVISPMLITFLHMDPYMAVGIALSSDVLASAVSIACLSFGMILDKKDKSAFFGSQICSTAPDSNNAFITIRRKIVFPLPVSPEINICGNLSYFHEIGRASCRERV